MKLLGTFLKTQYIFRRNEVLDRTEYAQRKPRTAFRVITERDLNSILYRCNTGNAESKTTLATLKALLNSDFVNTFDPFKEYFKSLPPWNKKNKDYIRELAGKITLSNPELHTTWCDYFERWLVACVAGTIDEKRTNHQVLVLVGSQGLGKSSFLNKLIPESLKTYLYTGSVDPNNKDTLVNLAENMFINLDELENLNKTELGNLKALITQSEIKLRRAYAVFNENLRRRASFMGSVNDAEFLTDTTGNRRYLIFTCEDIDYNHGLDMDLVYSQAYALYKSGKFKYIFDKEDLPKLEELAFDYLRISTEEDMLIKHYLPATREVGGHVFLTPTEILQEIEKKEGNIFDKYSSPRRLGQALHKHGFTKISKSNRKPYIIQRKEVAIAEIRDDRKDVSHIKTSGELSYVAYPIPHDYIEGQQIDLSDEEIEYSEVITNWKIKKSERGKGLIESHYFCYQMLIFMKENPSVLVSEEDHKWVIKNMCSIIDLDMDIELKEEIIKNVFTEFRKAKIIGEFEEVEG